MRWQLGIGGRRRLSSPARAFSAQTSTTIMATDGEVVLPPADEMPANSTITPTTYVGCIVAQNVYLPGSVVGILDGLPSAEACCKRCRANTTANTWQYCAQPEGCSYTRGPTTVKLDYQQCACTAAAALGADSDPAWARLQRSAVTQGAAWLR